MALFDFHGGSMELDDAPFDRTWALPINYDLAPAWDADGEEPAAGDGDNDDSVWNAFEDTRDERSDSNWSSSGFEDPVPFAADPMALALLPEQDTESYDSEEWSVPSSPMCAARVLEKLYAFETLADDGVLTPLEVMVAPVTTLALIRHLDAASLLVLSVVCKTLNARYAQFLQATATHRSVRGQFARVVLAHGSWSLAHEFSVLFANTVHASMFYYAGVRGFAIPVYELLAGMALSVVERQSYLRMVLCGAVRGGHELDARTIINCVADTIAKDDINAILSMPMDALTSAYARSERERVRGDPNGARALVDFLVTVSAPDMGYALELVGRGYVRMTTYATRAIIKQNRNALEHTRVPAGTLVVAYGNNLVAAYMHNLVAHIRAACQASDMKRLTLMWETHDTNLVAHAVTENNTALIECVASAPAKDSAQRLQKIAILSSVLERCTHYDGVCVAHAAEILGSLRLFEMAFDSARARPAADAAYPNEKRLTALLGIAAQAYARAPVAKPAPVPASTVFQDNVRATASLIKPAFAKAPRSRTLTQPISPSKVSRERKMPSKFRDGLFKFTVHMNKATKQ